MGWPLSVISFKCLILKWKFCIEVEINFCDSLYLSSAWSVYIELWINFCNWSHAKARSGIAAQARDPTASGTDTTTQASVALMVRSRVYCVFPIISCFWSEANCAARTPVRGGKLFCGLGNLFDNDVSMREIMLVYLTDSLLFALYRLSSMLAKASVCDLRSPNSSITAMDVEYRICRYLFIWWFSKWTWYGCS